MPRISFVGRVGAALVVLLAAAPCAVRVSAQGALPKIIRLAGPGNAEGKPFGTGTLGVLKVKGYLEDEFRKDGIHVDWQFPRSARGRRSTRLSPTASSIWQVMAAFRILSAAVPVFAPKCWRLTARPRLISWRGMDPVSRPLPISRAAKLRCRWELPGAFARRHSRPRRPEQKDIQIFDLITADQISAIQSGDVDAVVGTSSVLSIVNAATARLFLRPRHGSIPRATSAPSSSPMILPPNIRR